MYVPGCLPGGLWSGGVCHGGSAVGVLCPWRGDVSGAGGGVSAGRVSVKQAPLLNRITDACADGN